MDETILKEIEAQVASDVDFQMDAGFGVLIKDYAIYLEKKLRDDATLFDRVYTDFSNEEFES